MTKRTVPSLPDCCGAESASAVVDGAGGVDMGTPGLASPDGGCAGSTEERCVGSVSCPRE